jgi:cell division protein YceG involved in septum cleavage
MVFSSLNEKLSLGIGATRYKIWLSLFAPKLPSLQAGEYSLSAPTSLTEFLTVTLKKPVHSDITITVLPGWNMYDIDAYLASKNISKTGEFISAATINFRLYQEKYDFLV